MMRTPSEEAFTRKETEMKRAFDISEVENMPTLSTQDKRSSVVIKKSDDYSSVVQERIDSHDNVSTPPFIRDMSLTESKGASPVYSDPASQDNQRSEVRSRVNRLPVPPQNVDKMDSINL